MGGVEKLVGNRKYRVYGLDAKATTIRAAAGDLTDAIVAAVSRARTAVEPWHGPHGEVFAGRVNNVFAAMVTLQLEGEHAAARCASFPAEPLGSSMVAQYSYQGARVHAPGSGSVVAADPSAMSAFFPLGSWLDRAASRLAAAVDTIGLTADVSELRGLNTAERERWREQGVPPFEIDAMRVWSDPVPVPVREVFTLADLTGAAGIAGGDAIDLAAWVSAVAAALDAADRLLLQLLMDHPELAAYIDDDVLTSGQMSGELALLVVLANLERFDTAAGRGDVDRTVGLDDLEAIAGDPNAPEHLRAAADYLLKNRLLLSQVSIIDQPIAFEVLIGDSPELTPERIELFLAFNAAVREVGLGFDRLDTAADGDDPDGYVSVEDLQRAASGPGFSDDLRAAAAFLLANPMLSQRLGLYGQANNQRSFGSVVWQPTLTAEQPMGFDRNGVIALAIDQQAFASDPTAANRFVLGLPMADHHGDGGLPLWLVSSEGLKALTNAALLDVRGDLSGQHAVIAHLPETASWAFDGPVEQVAGVRNRLITGFYDLLATRADALFAGPDLAGHPTAPGHPGANWLHFAPWASDTVGGVIRGDTRVFGITTGGVMQAAADGNQWIFDDIGARYSAFIELYEQNAAPTEAQLERFFDDHFDDGDGTIRTGFAAYVAAMEESDPTQTQHLLFQGNTLVATHEQAGAQVYLERVSAGPDWFTARYVDANVGGETLDLDQDLPPGPTANNLVIPTELLSLDTGAATADTFRGDRTTFVTGIGSAEGAVDLRPISGIELVRPDFSPSTTTWVLEGGGDPGDPDSLRGSGASSWPDWEERMHAILRLFEQNHTSLQLFETEIIEASLDHVAWLDPEARPHE